MWGCYASSSLVFTVVHTTELYFRPARQCQGQRGPAGRKWTGVRGRQEGARAVLANSRPLSNSNSWYGSNSQAHSHAPSCNSHAPNCHPPKPGPSHHRYGLGPNCHNKAPVQPVPRHQLQYHAPGRLNPDRLSPHRGSQRFSSRTSRTLSRSPQTTVWWGRPRPGPACPVRPPPRSRA